MKKIVLLLFTLMFVFSSCNEDERYFDKNIVGKWERLVSDNDGIKTFHIRIFNEDRTGMSYYESEENGNRKVSENHSVVNVLNYYLEKDAKFNSLYTKEDDGKLYMINIKNLTEGILILGNEPDVYEYKKIIQ